MKHIVFITLLLIAGCQSTNNYKPKHFLDGIKPDIGKYGYSPKDSGGYWSVHNTVYSDNDIFGLLYLNWANLPNNQKIMWVTTTPGGNKYCTNKDVFSGHGALKINGKWVKSEFSCISNGVLSFSLEKKFITSSFKIDVGVVFDRYGEPARVYELDVFFDNTRVINAMKFAYDKSVTNTH
jgi:hypothetical protein